jgi:hypothetical protein
MNITLEMLSEFISHNYDMLKSDYNKLTKEEKSRLPSALYFIIVFDKLLTAQQRKNEQDILDKSNASTQVEEGK